MNCTDGELMRRVKEAGLMPRLVARYEAGWMPVAVMEADQMPIELVVECWRIFEAIESVGGELPKTTPVPVTVMPDNFDRQRAAEVGAAVFQVAQVVVKGFGSMAGALLGGLVSGMAEAMKPEPTKNEPYNPVRRVGRIEQPAPKIKNNIVVNGGTVIINNYNR